MTTLVNVAILFALDAGTRLFIYIRRALKITAPILIVSLGCLTGSAARAQGMGYMRVLTTHGQISGESTDPVYNGWIPLRQTKMPTATQLAAMAAETTASKEDEGKVMHPPVVIVKDRDRSSLTLLAAYTSHQHFPEIDIVVMKFADQPTARYKLTDATVISVRASAAQGTEEPVEQLRIAYGKIELQR